MTDYNEDDDNEFMMAFGGRRGAAKAKKLTSQQPAEGTSSPRLRMPERVIAREARKHHKAVNTLLRRGDTARLLALDGLQALEQSDSVGTTLQSTDDKDDDEENNEENEAGADLLDSEDGSDVRALLDQAFRQAIAAEAMSTTDGSSKIDENVDAVLRSWAVCYGLADRMLQRATSVEESDGPARAMMASLSHQAVYLERQGKLRNALEALDRAVELSKKSICDAAMLRGVSRLLKSAGKVCQRLGSIETMHKRVLKAVEIDDFLEARGEKKEDHQQQQDQQQPVVDKAVQEDEKKKKEIAAKTINGAHQGPTESTKRDEKREDKTVNGFSPSPTSITAEKAPSLEKNNTSSAPSVIVPETPKASSPPAPITTQAPIPSLPTVVPTPIPSVASDGSANSLFVSAAKSAMFQQDFQQLLHLLNRALLGDAIALEALWCSMPVANVSLLMVAAGSDRSDLVKRLLGLLPVKEVQSKIVKDKDMTGSNAIAHACTLGRSSSLDALLRRLHVSKPAYTPFAPTPGGPLESASLSDLGLSLEQARSFPPLLQAQLRFFVADPEAYSKTTAPVPINGVWSAPMPQLIHPVVTLPMLLAQQQAFLSNLLTMAQTTSNVSNTSVPTSSSLPLSSPNSSSYVAPDAPSLPPPPASFLSPRNAAQKPITSSNSTAAPTPNSNNSKSATTTATATAASGGAKAKNNAKERRGPVPQAIPQLTPNVSKAAGEGKLVGRKLVAWTNDDSNSSGALIPEGELLDGGVASVGGGGGKSSGGAARFDQFKVNEQKFGLKASFDETQYTTPLDASKFTKEQIESADRLAAEIKAMESADASSNPHVRDERGQAVAADDDDEEALYSAVLGNRGGGGGNANKDSFTDAGVSTQSHQHKTK